MDYSIRFIGHVLESKRPSDWPMTVENSVVFRAEEQDQVLEYLTMMGKKIKLDQCLFCNIDLDGQEKSDKSFGNGKLIPLHMLSHVSFSVRALASPMPDDDAKGGFVQ